MGRINDIQEIRQIILDAITFPEGGYLNPDIRESIIQSSDQNRFLVIRTGWDKGENTYAVIQDIELREGFILIHRDNTEDDLADSLREAGIAASYIIKAYVNPAERDNDSSLIL